MPLPYVVVKKTDKFKIVISFSFLLGMKTRAIIGLVVFLLSVIQVSAIGISPSRLELPFEANTHKEFTITLLNSGTKPLNASLELRGDIADYFTVEKGFFVIPPEQSKTYFVTVDFPERIKRPGNHILSFDAVQAPIQIPGAPRKGIAATVTVHSELVVFVPYPGKYAEVSLDMLDVNEGEESLATVTLVNYGLDVIRSAEAVLEVSDPSGDILTTLRSAPASILSQQEYSFEIPIATTEYPAGIFPVSAFATYDSLVTDPVEGMLRIGSLSVNITNHTSVVFTNTVSAYELYVQNLWNNKIEQLYGEIQLFRGSIPVGSLLKTPSIQISPWETVLLSTFLDATALEPGMYEAKVKLYFHEQTYEATLPLTVQKPFALGITHILAGIIILMVVIDILVFLYHRRTSHEKD